MAIVLATINYQWWKESPSKAVSAFMYCRFEIYKILHDSLLYNVTCDLG